MTQIDAKDIIEALQGELDDIRRRLYEVETKNSKIHSLFENYFERELNERVHGKGSNLQDQICCSIDRLDQLKYKLAEQQAQQDKGTQENASKIRKTV